jgi:hypothetical protein
MARTKLTPYQLELRRQQNDGARTENLTSAFPTSLKEATGKDSAEELLL